MGLSYTEGVFNDKNSIKRWLQRQRLISAMRLAPDADQNINTIVDFGAGNGELCKLLISKYPHAKIICYEPAPSLFAEAQQQLAGLPNIEFCSEVKSIPSSSADLLFCLEVFEHLPENTTIRTFEEIGNIVNERATIVIGVPVEIGIPAIYKGLFRMKRRLGAYDANVKNVFLSAIGLPPKNRPLSEIGPDLLVHSEHTGFDHREFCKKISQKFLLQKKSSSPLPILGTFFNPEAYFVLRSK